MRWANYLRRNSFLDTSSKESFKYVGFERITFYLHVAWSLNSHPFYFVIKRIVCCLPNANEIWQSRQCYMEDSNNNKSRFYCSWISLRRPTYQIISSVQNRVFIKWTRCQRISESEVTCDVMTKMEFSSIFVITSHIFKEWKFLSDDFF